MGRPQTGAWFFKQEEKRSSGQIKFELIANSLLRWGYVKWGYAK